MLSKRLHKKLICSRLYFLVILFLMPACSKNDSNPAGNFPDGINNQNPDEWLIPTTSVYDGGPGKDGIPSIDSPRFSSPSDTEEFDFLRFFDWVIGVKVGEDVRAYPHFVLDWHEIVNDEVGGLPLSITYCPLTGTAIGWERTLNGEVTTFGVSGLLYNTNLMPYDRASNSTWSQMLQTCVNGPKIGTEIKTYPLIETTWGHWKEMYPDSKVLNTNTGFFRSYGTYPYDDYKVNNDLLFFPVENEDDRLEVKERGLGVVVDAQSRFYRFQDFSDNDVVVFNDELNGKSIVVVGSNSRNFLVAYNRTIEDGVILSFSPVEKSGHIIMKDQMGNKWTIFGEAVEGPYNGKTLSPLNSYLGMWFAWAAFHPDIEIFQP